MRIGALLMMMRNLTGLLLLLALVLAACGPKPGEQPPPTAKPGAFQLSGSIDCVAGQATLSLNWTASSGANGYTVFRADEAHSDTVTAPGFTEEVEAAAGTVLSYRVRASNAQGSTDSNTLSLTVPDCQEVTNERQPVSLAVGSNHTLLALQDGSVVSWGANDQGMLGRPDQGEPGLPETVTGLQDVKLVAAGTDFSLALDLSGNVWSWGGNAHGQLGTGDGPGRHTPAQLTGFSEPIQAIAAGDGFAVALGASGQVYGWGLNNGGQLGNSDLESSSAPIEIEGVSGVQELVAGDAHLLARLADGTVMAWGSNAYGQLGYQREFGVVRPAVIPDLAGVVQLAAGKVHSLALTDADQLFAWGQNYYGQLGTGESGSSAQSDEPVQVDASMSFRSVYAGGSHTMAQQVSGAWYAWGLNGSGQLGDGTNSWRTVPVPTLPDRQFVLLALGQWHTVAVDASGQVYAWGSQGQWQLGTPFEPLVAEPTGIEGLSDVVALAAGSYHTLALTDSGEVYAWGSNIQGQLGMGDEMNRFVPTRISLTGKAQMVAAGSERSYVLLEDGTVMAFGSNSSQLLGVDSEDLRVLSPLPVPGLSGITAIAAGGGHVFALDGDATLHAWGSNLYGQLGVGTTDQATEPVELTEISNVLAISTSSFTAMALGADRTVHMWGDGRQGQLGGGGSGPSIRSLLPGQVGELEDVTVIGLGDAAAYAVRDGELWVWGGNAQGQLGSGSVGGLEPRPVLQDSGVLNPVSIQGGAAHALVLQADGHVMAWGSRVNGQVGDGVQSDEPVATPVEVLEGVKGISAGPYNSFAILENGNVMAWGRNEAGELGLGTADYAPTPQPVDY